MMKRLSSWILAAWLTAAALLPAAANAHEMTMAEVEVRETSPGEFLWQYAATNEKRPGANELIPHWPTHCVTEPNALHCGPEGLKGTVEFEGVGRGYSAVLMKVYWADGQARVYTLTRGQPTVQLFGSSVDNRGWSEIASAYTVLGIEHILSGYDHLLFVFGLLFLVGFQRKLVWTITAFTLAHSLTLASAAMGWLTLRPPPVEATIALSIVLVAAEALNPRLTLARRFPAMLAFMFGLIHGLGFAGALKEVGLPEHNLPVALLTFNVGVEIGQLLTVGFALLVWLALRRSTWFQKARTPALYGIGSVAAFWAIQRVVAILG
jgi:hydrogenase/urease accessory protein HupE